MDTCFSIFSNGDFNANHGYAFQLETLGRYYRKYEELMAHWHEVLDLPILDLQYEELVADQEGKTRELLAFCGLEWDERCLAFHRSGRLAKTPSYDQVRQPIYRKSVERWRNYAEHLEPLRRALAGEG
jgi:hypothetical protein